MHPKKITEPLELNPIPEKESPGLQVFLEAFFSPIAIMAWMFLVIGVLWLYCEIFIFKR